ncbi:hypothetical protein CGRA01v4_00557 [Colletotrichum graminicola]|nr:hypothetical protein CGRA01v4_00557 [Colletotrichum graminicola]
MIPAMLDSICQSSRYQETALSNFSHRRARPNVALFQLDTACPHCQSAIIRIPWRP